MVTKIGFGSIINFDIRSLPSKLGLWLVSNYDPTSDELNLGTHVIKVTAQTVHEILGIPLGKVKFNKLKNPSMKNHVVAEFRKQYYNGQKLPTPRNVLDHLAKSKDTGRLFKLNFLTVYMTIMAEITQGGTLYMKFLPFLEEGVHIKSFDWCSLVLACLNKTVRKYIGKQFTGPLTFLTVCYFL